MHRQRVRKHGAPDVGRWPEFRERVLAKIAMASGCWLWTGVRTTEGYGQVWRDGRMRMAHREVYELLRGPIDHGLVLDHLCRTPACVNPDHVEPVTQAENVQRGARIALKGRVSHG